MSTSSTAIVPGVRWSRWWQALLLAVALVAAGAAAFSPARAAGDGTAVAWGDADYGQLGNGVASAAVPVAVDASGVLSGKTVTAVSAGSRHTCAVADGKAYCWGDGEYGRLGNNSTSSSLVPVAVDTSGVLAGKTVTAVTASDYHTCAVADGKAYCWGEGVDGKLGNNASSDSSVPVAVDTSGVLAGKTVTAVTAGTSHTCAVADGKAYCWGWGLYGQLGINSSSSSLVPVAVDTSGVLSGKTVTAVSAGNTHTCAVADGKAYCWGKGAYGRLGNNSTSNSLVPVAVDTSGVLSGKTVTALTSGSIHTCAVADGKPYCWGNGDYGELGNNSTSDSAVPVAVDTSGALSGKTVTTVTAGGDHTCAVADGKAYCWGDGGYGQLGNNSTSNSLVPVAVDTSGVLAGKTVTAVAAGQYHTCAVADGKAYCWGDDYEGQLGNNTNSDSPVPVAVDTSGALAGKTVTTVSAGEDYTCAVADGKAYCWGSGSAGRLGNNSTNGSTKPVAVDTSGVLSGKIVTAVSAGNSHTCAVADGKAYCWGDGYYGQLGNNSNSDSPVPVAVDTSGVLSGKTVTAVAAGEDYTCAVAEGKAYCWGYGGNGRLGNNSNSNSLVPVAVDTSGALSGKTVTTVTAGWGHACAVAGGKAYCWGAGYFGQLGDNTSSNSLVPVGVDTSGVLSGKTVTTVSAGGENSCAVADGKAYCWGPGYAGQLGNDSTSDSAVPVAVDTSGLLAGKTVSAVSTGSHTCAVAGGKAYCWGSGSIGELGNNDKDGSLVPVAVDTSGILSGKAVIAVSAGSAHTVALYGTGSPAAVPDAPSGVSGAAGDAQVTLSWSAPASDGGSPILAYEATASPGGKTCTTDGATTCTVTGLTNGQAYTFTVKARNAQGWSLPSTASPAVTPTVAVVTPPVTQPPVVSVPAAVTGVKSVVRKGKVTVTWKAVSGATSYQVRISKPGGKKYRAWKTSSVTKFTAKVSKGKKYRVQILPVGAGGKGPTKTVKFKGR